MDRLFKMLLLVLALVAASAYNRAQEQTQSVFFSMLFPQLTGIWEAATPGEALEWAEQDGFTVPGEAVAL